MLTIDSWIDSNGLPDSIPFEEIATKGIPQKNLASADISFQTGRMAYDMTAKSGKLKMRFLLCKVAIGKAFNCNQIVAASAKVPEGYDSFVIDENNLTPNQSALKFDNWLGANPKPNSQKYIVKENAQVLPMYIVSFELDLELEKAMRDCPKCGNCEISPASLHCETDQVNLCVACDASLHSGKVGSKHVRTSLDKSARMSSACKEHPEKLIEFYCPTCNIPVCVHCKMTGHHSSGESSRHKLVSIMDAYRSIFESSQNPDQIFDGRKREIVEQVQAILDRAKAIEGNQSTLERELEDRFRRALTEIRVSVCKKFNLLKGELAELSRRQMEMTNVEEFLNYQKSGGAVLQFILDWSHFLRLKSEIHATNLPKCTNFLVDADMKIIGNIGISSANKQVFLNDENSSLEFVQSPTQLTGKNDLEKFNSLKQDVERFQAVITPDQQHRKLEDSYSETLKTLKTFSLSTASPQESRFSCATGSYSTTPL